MDDPSQTIHSCTLETRDDDTTMKQRQQRRNCYSSSSSSNNSNSRRIRNRYADCRRSLVTLTTTTIMVWMTMMNGAKRGIRSVGSFTPKHPKITRSHRHPMGIHRSPIVGTRHNNIAEQQQHAIGDFPSTAATTTTRLYYTPLPENLYRSWTLEQDRLLWSQREKALGDLAVLLGRGMKGVEQRLAKLQDVNSEAYQRLFAGGGEQQHDSEATSVKTKSKPSKLVPSSEVLRRIEWDPNLDPEDFFVLHYDRVEDRVVTSPLTAPNQSIDSNERFLIKALPEHRIVGIRFRERIVWDRRARVDFVFGPPGIETIMDTYPQWKEEQKTLQEEREKLRSIWNDHWRNRLGNSASKSLSEFTSKLLTQEEESQDEVDPFVDPRTLPPDEQQRLDAYVRSVANLFRDVADATEATSRTENDDASDSETNTDNRVVELSLWNELSEWIASPCFASVEDYDGGNDPEPHGDSSQSRLRATLLRKLASTMEKLEGKTKTSRNKTAKKSRQQQQQEHFLRRQSLLDESEVVETFVRGSGSGGQKINKTSNRVVLVHTPTNLRVECQDTRSLSQNRKLARKRLVEKLDAHFHGQDSKEGQQTRKLQSKKKKSKSKSKARLAAKQAANKKKKEALRAKQLAAEEEEFGGFV